MICLCSNQGGCDILITLILIIIVFVLQVGGVTSSQMSVFEEFARSIPGFLPPEASGAPSEPFPKPMQEPMGSLFNTTSSDQHVRMDLSYSQEVLSSYCY